MNILITGGTKGIGKATALRFAKKGNHVFMNYYHDDEAAEIARKEVLAKEATPHLLKYNLGNHEAVSLMVNEIKKSVDSIDLIVHCATGIVSGDSLGIPIKEWKKVFEVSSLSLIAIVQESRPLLKYGSSIIALSGKGAVKALPNYAALGTTKAFNESLIRYLAVELAPHGIRANVVSSGTIDTEAFRTMYGDKAEKRLEDLARLNPSGRSLTTDDVTGMIELLSRPEAQMVQGEIIHIDGGLYLK